MRHRVSSGWPTVSAAPAPASIRVKDAGRHEKLHPIKISFIAICQLGDDF
jgi:hypothetical protein